MRLPKLSGLTSWKVISNSSLSLNASWNLKVTKVPNKFTICRLVSLFREAVCVGNRKSSGRWPVLTEETLETIHQSFMRSLQKSSRKMSQQAGIFYRSVQRSTKKLNLCPYQINDVHELQKLDRAKRLQYCWWFLRFFHNGMHILDYVFFSDEGWFHPNELAPFPWEPVTFPESWNLVCSFAQTNSGPNSSYRNGDSWLLQRDIIQQFILLLDVHKHNCWLQQDDAT